MSLPFLDPRKAVSIIIAQRKGKGDLEVKDEKRAGTDGTDSGLVEAAEDILRAIDERSALSLAQAIKSAYEICESYEEDSEEEEEA